MPTTPKSDRRRALRARRRDIAADRDLAADDAALAGAALALVRSRGLGAGSVVTSYESVAGEPPTPGINEALRAAGLRVLVPDTLPDLDLDWHELGGDPADRLGTGAVDRADLVLAPGLAVDGHGTRIGQGGGCYDRALPRRRPGVPVVVLLHPGELLGPDDEPLPREVHDQPVDAVLTADGLTVLAD